MAARHARERRRRHRHRPARLRTPAARVAPWRSPLPHRALHGGRRLAGAPDTSLERDPDAVLDLRVLSWREDERVRPGALEPDVRAALLPRRGHSRHASLRLSPGTLRTDDGA